MLANAEGVAQDFEEAYAWLWLAVESGEAEARAGLDNLDRLMSAEAKARALERAKQLLSKVASGAVR